MSITTPSSGSRAHFWRQFLLMLALLCVVLGFSFFKSLDPNLVLFSNDGPLGANSADAVHLPGAFHGTWFDLSWLGSPGAALPNFTYGLLWLFGPVAFAKFYAPSALIVLGLSAWFFFRQRQFHPAVCILGGFAAALNMNVFSNACWGLPTRATTLASMFFALAMFPLPGARWQIPRLILSGFGVGLGVMEGFDVGAIYSLYVAAFAVFVSCTPEVRVKRLVLGVGKAAVIGICAGFLAAAALVVLIQTQVQGVVGMKQDAESKAAQWDRATDWSLPKIETLRVIIPGSFGYTMQAGDGSVYWGLVGPNGGRHTGSGEYAGILVVFVAAWAFAQTFRRKNPVYEETDRKVIRFFSVAAVISVLFAFGRFAPFYRLIYALPYFSTIRLPIKFLHPCHLALGILFGYGLQGLWKRYILVPVNGNGSLTYRLGNWWKTGPTPDRRWVIGSGAAITLSLFGWIVFAGSKGALTTYLKSAGFGDERQAQQVEAIIQFANGEFGLYLIFLALSALLVTAILAGLLSGARSKWAAILLGLTLVVDLTRADLHWISYYDYKDQYASNLILDLLRDKPYEHRVTAPPFLVPPQPPQIAVFSGICSQWSQHQFLYYNIQSLEYPGNSRRTEEYESFTKSFGTLPLQPRHWELTNTRYLLGVAGYLDPLNNQIDPVQKRFRIHTPFELYQEPGGPILARTNAAGPFAVFEFTGALPRAKLYAEWTVNTNDPSTLATLADTNFNPQLTVLVATPPGGSPNPTAPKREPGNVSITHYAPKRIELAAQVTNPAILLLNDRFDSNWKVTVNGKPKPLLRCNFLMRGVYLEAGEQTVVFTYEPSQTGLHISLAAIGMGLALMIFLALVEGKTAKPTEAKAKL